MITLKSRQFGVQTGTRPGVVLNPVSAEQAVTTVTDWMLREVKRKAHMVVIRTMYYKPCIDGRLYKGD